MQHQETLFCFLSCLGNKHHQRGPGKQPGDGSRGPGPSVGDPENHGALLAPACLQRGRSPHQWPRWGTHACAKQHDCHLEIYLNCTHLLFSVTPRMGSEDSLGMNMFSAKVSLIWLLYSHIYSAASARTGSVQWEMCFYMLSKYYYLKWLISFMPCRTGCLLRAFYSQITLKSACVCVCVCV